MNHRYELVTEQDFPGGVRCGFCHLVLSEGWPYATFPEGIDSQGQAIVLIVCVYCELSPPVFEVHDVHEHTA